MLAPGSVRLGARLVDPWVGCLAEEPRPWRSALVVEAVEAGYYGAFAERVALQQGELASWGLGLPAGPGRVREHTRLATPHTSP